MADDDRHVALDLRGEVDERPARVPGEQPTVDPGVVAGGDRLLEEVVRDLLHRRRIDRPRALVPGDDRHVPGVTDEDLVLGGRHRLRPVEGRPSVLGPVEADDVRAHGHRHFHTVRRGPPPATHWLGPDPSASCRSRVCRGDALAQTLRWQQTLGSGRGEWQAEADAGAAPRPGGHADVAAVADGDVAHDRQPEARARQGAGAVGPVEAVEDPRRIVRAGCPGPRSCTVTAPSSTTTSIGLSVGSNLAALSMRLEIARSSAGGGASTTESSAVDRDGPAVPTLGARRHADRQRAELDALRRATRR